MTRQKILGIVIAAMFLLMFPAQVFAATCYPPAKTDGSRVYLATIGKSYSNRIYLYGTFPANTLTKINRVDMVGYLWTGAYCTTSDTYFGRVGFSMYDNPKDGRHCIGDFYIQYKKSATSWPTLKAPVGWCGKWEDMPIYVTVALAPWLIQQGASVVVPFAKALFDGIARLPSPWWRVPHPVPTYV
ncbi:MAG: hypothetical protein JW727_00440 [Candidatus Aenigmarchaeota archaeon]|nr:hypothetical protein [Candidatus Aenigmarchaeota archaeon]